MNDNSKEWLTAEETAAQLEMPVATFYRKFREDKLSHIESKQKLHGRGFLYRFIDGKKNGEASTVTSEVTTLLEMLREKDQELQEKSKQTEHYMSEFFRLQAEIGQIKLLTEGRDRELESLNATLAEKEKQIEMLTGKKWWQIWK